MAGEVIAAGIAAAATGVSTAINSSGRRKSQKRAYEYQRKLMEYQNEIALKNWQLENEYNSPSAQMQRYQDAGLNPNLIYGQQNTSGSIGEYQPSAVTPIESVGETVGQTIDAAITNFFEIYQKNQAIEAQMYANKSARYNADMAELNFKVATATLDETIDAKLSELHAIAAEMANKAAYEGGKSQADLAASGSFDASAQYYESDTKNSEAIGKSFATTDSLKSGELYQMYSDEIKKIAIDYAIAVRYGEKNAQSESIIKESAATINKIEAQWKDNFDKMDWQNMSKGQIFAAIVKFIAFLK